MGIKLSSSGSYAKTESWITQMRRRSDFSKLQKYGEEGVRALRENTPVDTGLTAASWYYTIDNDGEGTYSINFCNRNIVDYVPIAVILQYGHATKNGGWVEGTDYINPAIQPIFEKMADEAWKEVKMG